MRVCKRTIQKYIRQAHITRPRGQNWATFLRNHAREIWACDFLQVTDLFFRSLFAFFITLLESRKVIHVGVTRSPTDAWVAQQLREATPYGQVPRYLIHDNDSKFGPAFARVAATSSIKLLKTPSHAPRANAVCERFLGSVRPNVLIICLSCMRNTGIACSRPTWSTSITCDRIKVSNSKSLSHLDLLFHQSRVVAR